MQDVNHTQLYPFVTLPGAKLEVVARQGQGPFGQLTVRCVSSFGYTMARPAKAARSSLAAGSGQPGLLAINHLSGFTFYVDLSNTIQEVWQVIINARNYPLPAYPFDCRNNRQSIGKNCHCDLPHSQTGWQVFFALALRALSDSRVRLGTISAGIDFGYLRAEDTFSDVEAVSTTPFFRIYPYRSSGRRVYFESGAGLIRFNEPFPGPNDRDSRLGTETNGISRYGLGIEWQMSQKYLLGLGARHTHISNGNRRGEERNPSHDSNGINLTLRYQLALI